jgi:hypothetical protein
VSVDIKKEFAEPQILPGKESHLKYLLNKLYLRLHRHGLTTIENDKYLPYVATKVPFPRPVIHPDHFLIAFEKNCVDPSGCFRIARPDDMQG